MKKREFRNVKKKIFFQTIFFQNEQQFWITNIILSKKRPVEMRGTPLLMLKYYIEIRGFIFKERHPFIWRKVFFMGSSWRR